MGDQQPGMRELPAGTYSWEGQAKTGYMRAGSYTGTFTIDGTCENPQTPVTPPTLSSQPLPATNLLPVRVRVISATMCTPEKNATQVVIEIEPSSGGTVAMSKEGLGMVNSSTQGVQYLPNGTYTWQVIPNPGYIISGQESGTLTLSSCPLSVYPVVSVGTACDLIEEGVPVTFEASGSGKTYFSVLNVATRETLPLQPGVEYFPNGTYTWTAVPASGSSVTFMGPSSGSFSISSCKTPSNTTYVPPKAGTLLFFRDGKLIDPIVRQGEKIAVRVDVSGASSVQLERVGKDSREVLGVMEKDPGTSRWLYVWNVGSPVPGEYDLVAKAIVAKRETVSGSRLVKILLRDTLTPPSLSLLAPKELSLDEASAMNITLSDAPVFTRISDGMVNTDSTITLAVRGVADLVSTSDILSAKNTLPDVIRSPEDLRVFCADKENDDLCLRLLPEGLRDEARGVVEEARKAITQAFNERVSGTIDTDKDGLSDFDEIHFYGTDPAKVDSDADGKNDHVELLSDENALLGGVQYSRLMFENPMFGGLEKKDLFSVRTVEVGKETSQNSFKDKKRILPIHLSGHAPSNAIVTLYIYSEPIVVRIKADESGLWNHTLTVALPDGSHQAYAAMTDSAGRVLAKSAPLSFTKKASTVSLATQNPPGIEERAQSFFSGGSFYTWVFLIVGVMGFSVLAVGVVVRSRREDIVVPSLHE